MSAGRKFLGSPILGTLNAPNVLTLTGLGLAALSTFFAMAAQFHAAILCLIWSGVADLFDGYVARSRPRTELESEVGKHLDSLCDMCSFGLAPAVFLVAYASGGVIGLPPSLANPAVGAVGILLVLAAALRLAYFGAAGMTSEGDTQYFTGMPVTYVALFVPLFFLVDLAYGPEAGRFALFCLYILLAQAMVAGWRVPKPKGIWYGLFAVLATVLTGVYAWAIVAGR